MGLLVASLAMGALDAGPRASRGRALRAVSWRFVSPDRSPTRERPSPRSFRGRVQVGGRYGRVPGHFPPAGTGTTASPRRDRDASASASASRDGDGSPASSSSPSSGASSSSSRLDDLDDAALASRALDALARGEEEATRAHSRLFAGGVALDESVAALAPYAREPGAIERVVTVRSARAKTNAPPPFAVLTPEEKLNLTRLLRRAAKHALANRSAAAAAARGEKNDDADGGAGATGAGEGRRRRRAAFAVDFEDVVDARRHGGGGRARRRDADEADDEYSRADADGSGGRLPRRTDANDDDAAASPGMKRTQPRRRAAAAAKKRWDPARDAFAFARELRAKLAEAKKRKENAARGERDRAPEGTRGREEAAAAGRERDFGGGEADSGEEEDPGGGSPPHEHEHEPAAASGDGGGDFSATSRRPLGAPPPRRPASPPPVAWRSSTRVALATGLPLELFEDDDDACDARVLEAERGLRDARVATEASAEANAADTRKAAAENKSSTEEGPRNAVSNARRNEPNASAGNDDDVHAADEMTEEDAARLAALRREAAAKLSRRYDASVAAAYSSSRERRLLPEKNREVVPPPMRFRDGFPSRPPKPGARAKAARYAGLWYAPIGARSAEGDAKARGLWADRATGTEKAERAREAAARREALDEACAGAYATRAYRKYLEETVDVERERVPAYVR